MVAFVVDDEGVAVVVVKGTDGDDDDVSMTPKTISTAFSSTQGAAGFATSRKSINEPHVTTSPSYRGEL